jgi:phi13 family phage major tail protein
MTIDTGGYKPIVGVSDLYYAEIVTDDLDEYTTGTVTWLAPLAELSQEPTVNSEVFYADNGAFDSASSEGETKISLTISNLPLETQAVLLGGVLDEVNGLLYDYGGTQPDVALGFRSKKSNGSYRYYWFLKGKFEKGPESAKTEGENVEFQPSELVFTAVKTIHRFDLSATVTDTVKRIVGDDDVAGFSYTGDTWFDDVVVPQYIGGSA